ncbi:unnamed protein product [Caenorhabditis nigoni]
MPVTKCGVNTEYGFGKFTLEEIRNDEIGPRGPGEPDYVETDKDDVKDEGDNDGNAAKHDAYDILKIEEDERDNKYLFNREEDNGIEDETTFNIRY